MCWAWLCFGLTGAARLQAQDVIAPRISTDGTVEVIVQKGDTTFYGGSFTNAGYYSFGLGLLEGTAEIPVQAFPMPNSEVRAAIPDGQGGWYIGGTFTQVDGQPLRYLAHVLPNRQLDLSFDLGLNGAVNALTLEGNFLYVGGEFTQLGGQSVSYLGRIDRTTGSLDGSWLPQPDRRVFSLHLNPGQTLYVGGDFDQIGGERQESLAELRLSDAAVLPGLSVNGSVHDIVVKGNEQFIGGSFSAGGHLAKGMAAFSSGSNAFPDRTTPHFNGRVNTIVEDGQGGWYVGGSFTQIDGQSHANLVHMLSDYSIDPAFSPSPNGMVNALLRNGPFLYVGGNFSQIAGQSQPYLARLDLQANGAFSNWTPQLDQLVHTLERHRQPNFIHVGGNFRTVNGQRQRYLALVSETDGSHLPGLSMNGAVHAIAQAPAVGSNGLTYLGGSFTAGGYYAPYCALIEAPDQPPAVSFPTFNGRVEVMVEDGNGGWFAGGSFTMVNGQTIRNLVHVLSDYSIDPGFNPDPNGIVYDLLRLNDELFVAGTFTQIGGQSMGRVGGIDGTTGQALSSWVNSGLATGANGTVNCLATEGTVLYLGGSFTQVNGQPRDRLASINLANGGVLGFNPGANGTVNAFELNGSDLYVGGAFSQVGGQARAYLARLDHGGQVQLGFDARGSATSAPGRPRSRGRAAATT